MVILESVEAQLQSFDELLRGIGGGTKGDRKTPPGTSSPAAPREASSQRRRRPLRTAPARGAGARRALSSRAGHSTIGTSTKPAHGSSARDQPDAAAQRGSEGFVAARVNSSGDAGSLIEDGGLLARAREFVRQAKALFPEEPLVPIADESSGPGQLEIVPMAKEATVDTKSSGHVVKADQAPAPELSEEVVVAENVDETDASSVASEDSLVAPRVMAPPASYIWTPLVKGAVTARGSSALYFHAEVREDNIFSSAQAQDLLICNKVYRVAALEETGAGGPLKVILDRDLDDAPENRDKDREGLVKVFAKVNPALLSKTQRDRSRRCGMGRVRGLSSAQTRPSRGREASERKRMALEEELQRKLEADERRRSELEAKAAELRAKTKARLLEQAKAKRAAELARQEALEREAAQRESRKADLETQVQRAAELSRLRIAKHRQKTKMRQDEELSTKGKAPRDSGTPEGPASSRSETPDLVRKSRERVRQRKESLRAAQEIMAAREKKDNASTRVSKPCRLSEEEMRRATRERRERFLKIARSVRTEEEAKYSRARRKIKTNLRAGTSDETAPTRETHVQFLSTSPQTRFPPLSTPAQSNKSQSHTVASASSLRQSVRVDCSSTSTRGRNNNNNDDDNEDYDDRDVLGSSRGTDVRPWAPASSPQIRFSVRKAQEPTDVLPIVRPPASKAYCPPSAKPMPVSPAAQTRSVRQGSYLFH